MDLLLADCCSAADPLLVLLGTFGVLLRNTSVVLLLQHLPLDLPLLKLRLHVRHVTR
jgi:hypothetical protein